MWFNSFLFLIFVPSVMVIYYGVARTWKVRKHVLLAASYVFYGSWNPPFVLLLAFSSGVDFLLARMMASEQRPSRRRAILVASCGVSLGVLFYFKYSHLALETYTAMMNGLGLSFLAPGAPNWLNHVLLPIGISFYTFHGLSYMFDVYRGRKEAISSWTDFFLFVSFFPQLVAGPILRAAQFLPQLETPRRFEWTDCEVGVWRISLGYFQKMVLADNLAPLANFVFTTPLAFTPGQQWIGTYAFALQIYFDFAGYSNIAIGVARLFGFGIPDNFNLPYLAVGLREFWRRWHISLSSFLRDYLYVPLGGSQRGPSRTFVNLLITMALGGLWHGATWSFAIWGLLHGLYLALEHALAPVFGRVPVWFRQSRPVQLLGIVLTFHLVCLAWVFFRLPTSIRDAFAVCYSMLHFRGWNLTAPGFERIFYLKVVAAGFLIAFGWTQLAARYSTMRVPRWGVAAGAAVMLYFVVVGWGDANEFIYFQF